MKLVKLSNAVSMYKSPVLGTVKAEKRVMALAVDKETMPFKGIARVIIRSQGSVDVPGFIDMSKLVIVESKNGLKWKEVRDLEIKGIEQVIESISSEDKYFIGLEDPDIWTYGKKIKHVYFTIAFKLKNKWGYEVYLGHAQGKNLESLQATLPVLGPIGKIRGFKEVAISPTKVNGERINLTEVQIVEGNDEYSAIASVKAKDMSKPWKYLEIALDPRKQEYSWCKGHLSPCTFLPEDFVKSGNLLVGIVNGREPEKIIDSEKVYGKFCPGLILYNPKTGEIPWIDEKPLLEDPDATTITFASDFFQVSREEGILYCHVNDSFVRAYKINAVELEKLLRK